MKSELPLLKQVVKGLVLLVMAFLLCRLTKGMAVGAIAGIAIMCVLTGRVGWALAAYAFFPLLLIMNPVVCPRVGLMGVLARGGVFVMSLCMVVAAAQRRGNHAIPINGIWPYLIVAAVSSANGYAPMISYLKLLSFVLFVAGVGIGFKNIDRRAQELHVVRIFYFSFVLLIVFGSYFVRVFLPGAAYLNTLDMAMRGDMGDANALVAHGGKMLFAGITNQSQCLAVMVPSCLAWLICDMLFVERRITKIHIITFLCGIPIVYMTGSRSAFLTTAVSAFIIYFYCLNKINISRRVRNSLRSAMTIGIVAMVCVCCVMEVKNRSISKWLRKQEDVQGDRRNFVEAFTQSRMSRVEENLNDFRQNPVIGMGFQVSWYITTWYKPGELVLSAPIEKGVLPLMVLGETGIIGGIAFVFFLAVFYATCIRKRYFCTLTGMTVFITTNMAEANFFSPGGVGGALWIVCIGGGFVTDTIALYRRRVEREMAEFARMRQMGMISMQGMPGWCR